jgi:hypothetical protein
LSFFFFSFLHGLEIEQTPCFILHLAGLFMMVFVSPFVCFVGIRKVGYDMLGKGATAIQLVASWREQRYSLDFSSNNLKMGS